MGYREELKAYKLYDLVTEEVFVTRDVKFDELMAATFSLFSNKFFLVSKYISRKCHY